MNTQTSKSPLADDPLWQLPLSQVLRAEIALLLRETLHVYTVGDFLCGWYSPRRRHFIEQFFDQPRQARQAAATCAAWLGVSPPADCFDTPPWWRQ